MLLVFFGVVLYLGGGALYNMQRGNPLGCPHVRFWNSVHGLVVDGFHFVSSGGKPAAEQGGTAGYAPVPVVVGPKAVVSGGTTCVSACLHPHTHSTPPSTTTAVLRVHSHRRRRRGRRRRRRRRRGRRRRRL
eukprot:COSAG03_NODE_11795_length_575_cov_2.149160_1_plen_132_part_00